MVEDVMSRVDKNAKGSLYKGDTLQIPKFAFDIEHRYKELLCKDLTNAGWEDYFIAEALQKIQFKLNEEGAKLKSSAVLTVVLGDCPRGDFEHRPIKLIFDRPFLIYLKEKGAKYPYFALWVDNPELLVKDR
jgi:hypothetical protein